MNSNERAFPKKRTPINLGRNAEEKKLINKRAAFVEAEKSLDLVIQDLFRFKEQLRSLLEHP